MARVAFQLSAEPHDAVVDRPVERLGVTVRDGFQQPITGERPIRILDEQTKQFELADGRKTTVARNVVAFCVAHKVDPEQKTIIGLRVSSVRPITVLAVYDDVRMWWSAQPSPSRNAGQEL